MRMSTSLLAACCAATVSLTAPAVHAASHAPPGDEADRARTHMRSGETLSLREIERRVLPRMRGAQYLGPEYDSRTQIYTLKFLKDGRVYFVDVDATTGRIIDTR